MTLIRRILEKNINPELRNKIRLVLNEEQRLDPVLRRLGPQKRENAYNSLLAVHGIPRDGSGYDMLVWARRDRAERYCWC